MSVAAEQSVPGQAAVQLCVRDGRAVLVGAEHQSEFSPERLPISEPLIKALHEWADVAEQVGSAEHAQLDGNELPAERAVSRRGRKLAYRLAVEVGTAITYVDPISGRRYRVLARRAGWAAHPGPVGDNTARAQEPTPWATGLTVSAAIAAIVTIVLVVVTSGLAEISPALAVLVNLAVAAGFAPSIWVGRRVPVWRWVAYGVAGGIGCAWFALLVSLLG